MERRKTREVQVGSVTIGGGHPVVVQSMTNTKTEDAAATLAQIRDPVSYTHLTLPTTERV